MAYQYGDADISRQCDHDMSCSIIWRCADICHDISGRCYDGDRVDISSGDMACLSKMSHDICGGDMV
jgi:hypothetical protein